MYHLARMTIARQTDIPAPLLLKAGRGEDWIERAAFTASLLCLVHCLALPLVIAALPMLARALALPESVHVWLLAFAIPASGAALLAGHVRHGAAWPLGAGGVGLLLLAVGALAFGGSGAETPLTVSGGLILASAHIGNWRLRHARHDCDRPEHLPPPELR